MAVLRSEVITLSGHRAMLVRPPEALSDAQPPLVLLGGTAQWLDSWAGHLATFARRRSVILYETRGQGGGFQKDSLERQFDYVDCSLPRHAQDFAEVVDPILVVVALSLTHGKNREPL